MRVRSSILAAALVFITASVVAGCSALTSNSTSDNSAQSSKFTSLMKLPNLVVAAGESGVGYKKKNGNFDGNVVTFMRSDGAPDKAQLYSPAQLVRRGNSLIFTEYYPAEKIAKGKVTSNNILYPLGGSIRVFNPGQSIKTIFRSKTVDGSKRAVRAITFDGQDIIFSRGNAIWRMDQPSGKLSVLAGSLNQAGNRDGVGSKARFAFSISMVRDGRNVYIADRENMSVRKLNLDSGRVSTYLSLPFKPQGLAIVDNKLWIAGSDLQSVSLDCQDDCLPRSHKLWPQTTVVGSALTSDERGSLFVVSPQGLFQYNIKSGSSKRLVRPSVSSQQVSQTRLGTDQLLDSPGLAVLGDKLYFISPRTQAIGSISLASL